MAISRAGAHSEERTKLNELWKDLLSKHHGGVSSTSTTKYDAIRHHLSTLLDVSDQDIYCTGAKTRTSNLDTRLVQGNQAGAHTKIGAAFLQSDAVGIDFAKLSDSAVVTARKFVDGTDKTQYDSILIFCEQGEEMLLMRVIERSDSGYSVKLKIFYPEATFIEVPKALPQPSPYIQPGISGPSSGQNLANMVEAFVAAAKDAGLVFETSMVGRVAASLLAKRFLILTGLAGSGKTKLAQAFAHWMTPQSVLPDAFKVGGIISGVQNDYTVVAADAGIVQLATEDGTLVPLPRVIIKEWADYIEANNVPESISARELRDKIEAQSKITGYLHRLESHYKPAAFALVAARKGSEPAKCYEIVPVGADWTGTESIIGYPDGLQPTRYVAKPTLDLILHASDRLDTPHFLILDEMNLSHVERYFADILSIIESGEGLELYSGDMEHPESWRQTATAKRVPPRLKQLPENLFIIGTVNVDETTYMFSPKVLDRASVIEFRMNPSELEAFLKNPAKPDLAMLDGKGASLGKALVAAANNPVDVPSEAKAAYDKELMLLFKALQAHGAEFGYRTAYETARFIHFHKVVANHADGEANWFSGAFDCVVVQKLLPKLHGSRAKLGPVLKKLWFLCVNDSAGRGQDELKAAEEAARSTDKKAEPSIVVPARAPYPLSAEKIGRMWRLLIENGFASFAEA